MDKWSEVKKITKQIKWIILWIRLVSMLGRVFEWFCMLRCQFSSMILAYLDVTYLILFIYDNLQLTILLNLFLRVLKSRSWFDFWIFSVNQRLHVRKMSSSWKKWRLWGRELPHILSNVCGPITTGKTRSIPVKTRNLQVTLLIC